MALNHLKRRLTKLEKAVEKPPAAEKPAKPPKPKGETVTYTCGHAEGLAALRGIACPACRSKAKQERAGGEKE